LVNLKSMTNGKLKILLFISLALNAILLVVFLFSLYQITEEQEDRKAELEETSIVIANLSNDLIVISRELDNKIVRIRELGGSVEELLVIKEELEFEIENLKTTNTINLSKITELNSRIRDVEVVLLGKDNEIRRLTGISADLKTENTTLRSEKQKLEESVELFEQDLEEVKEKITLAGRLKAENIRVMSQNRRGTESDDLRSRNLSSLRIVFDIPENTAADLGERDVFVQVYNPEGKLQFDIAKGSGTFFLMNKEEFYTAKSTILYNGQKQEVSISFEKIGEMNPGRYTVRITGDDYIMAQQVFFVK
jgi:hypothetical protein